MRTEFAVVNVVDLGAPEADFGPGDTPAPNGRGRTATLRAARAGGDAPRSSTQPIDRVHLSRYTLGNRDLEIEVLGLFAAEAPRTLERLRAIAAAEGPGSKPWRDACHTLKGSARAVGAVHVAALAATAESARPDGAADSGQLINLLDMAVAEAAACIAAL